MRILYMGKFKIQLKFPNIIHHAKIDLQDKNMVNCIFFDFRAIYHNKETAGQEWVTNYFRKF